MLEQRQYQLEVIQGSTLAFQNGAKRVMIEAPTGSGKTIMGLSVAKKIEPATVIWVAMRRNLLSQAAKENQKVGTKNVHYISMFDRNIKRLTDLPRPLMLIVDEGHHDSANTMVNLHNVINPDFILGLTATPYRTDKVKLMFEEVIRSASIHRLVRLGYLSQYHHYIIDKWSPSTVAEHYISKPEHWGQSVAYFLKREDVQEFYRIIMDNEDIIRHKLGRPVKSVIECIFGDTKGRDGILDDFRSGDVPLLANCMVLTEGFDAPTLETVWVRDSSRGPTTQMAGRVFRKHPEGNVKRVVQSKDTKYPVSRITTPLEQWVFEDSWVSITCNDEVDRECERMYQHIVSYNVVMPEFIMEKQKKNVAFDEDLLED